MQKQVTSAPDSLISSIEAFAVPPVANKSSISATLPFKYKGFASKVLVPYSKSYFFLVPFQEVFQFF